MATARGGQYLDIFEMNEREREMLKELFCSPLVSSAEVEEKGTLYLEAMTRWCASGVVGCKYIEGAGAESRLYWIKEANTLLPAEKVLTTHKKILLKGTPQKRSHHRFVSPLIQHGPGSTKRPRLGPAISSDDRREDSPTGCVVNSPVGGESHGGKQLNRIAKERTKDLNTSASREMMELLREKRVLEERLQVKEEQLRKLKMVQVYRTKNNLRQLDVLISKWREVSQEVAEQLLSKTTSQPRPVMHQLLDHLHIDHALIHYSSQDESFD